MIKATIILVWLSIVLGWGKKETSEPQEQTKAPSKSTLPDSNIGQPKVDHTKHERFLWEFETGSSVHSSPTIRSDGTVYFGSKAKKLYAIKAASKGPAKSPWPMRDQNPQHTGRAPSK